MSKQELEKAIENGESVWCLYRAHKEIEELYLSTNNKYKFEDVNYLGEGKEVSLIINCFWYYPLKYLFKTKAEAEHYLHHANVKRVEILPFLTWEEFDNGNRLIRFIGKNGEKCKLEGYQSDDKQSGFIDVVVNGTGSHIDYDYTEENFYKAYNECVRLFKGVWNE